MLKAEDVVGWILSCQETVVGTPLLGLLYSNKQYTSRFSDHWI
jgi:hypothetical protein